MDVMCRQAGSPQPHKPGINSIFFYRFLLFFMLKVLGILSLSILRFIFVSFAFVVEHFFFSSHLHCRVSRHSSLSLRRCFGILLSRQQQRTLALFFRRTEFRFSSAQYLSIQQKKQIVKSLPSKNRCFYL